MNRTCTYRTTRGQICCTECGKEAHLCSCQDPDDLAHHRLQDVEGKIVGEVAQRLTLFLNEKRDNRDNVVNSDIEFAEILRKLRNHRNADGTSTEDIHNACIRTAASILMISLRGDMDFDYEPDSVHSPEDR